MKSRVLIFAVILVMSVLFLFAFSVIAQCEAISYIIGDADDDSNVTVSDATTIQMKLAKLDVKKFNEKAADIDHSGLDITDATNIQLYLAKYPNTYNIGEEVVEEATSVTQSENESFPYDEYELPIILG